MDKRHRNKPATTRRARALRKDAPVPERILWGMLRARRLYGLRFRRQHPIGPYFADFYCAEHQLVVELDGISHTYTREADERRTRFIESHGLRVIRFSDDELLEDRGAVARTILREVGLLEKLYSPEHP